MSAADSALPRLSAFAPAGRAAGPAGLAVAPARGVRPGAGVVRPRGAAPVGMPSRGGRRLALLAVVLAHAGGAYFLARAAQIEPPVAATSIQVALMTLPQPLPAAAPAQPHPEPPPPQPLLRPPPPKPATPRQAAAPRPLSPSSTALAAPEAASEAVADASPPQPPAPPLAAPAAVSGAPSATPALVEARFDADYLANPAPVYPPLARRMREQGRVMLRVRVTEQGLPATIELSASSGSARLDAAAQQAVGRWRFVPARRGQQAVESWVLVPVVFKLEGS